MPSGQIFPLINWVGCWHSGHWSKLKLTNDWANRPATTLPPPPKVVYHHCLALVIMHRMHWREREDRTYTLGGESKRTLIVIHSARSTCWRPSIMNCANILIVWQTRLIYQPTCSLLSTYVYVFPLFCPLPETCSMHSGPHHFARTLIT